ncbi:hypothetical protein [Actinacidiphila acididurans]|uniref:Lipoprotein n=1 Tax=Actinacidiphila acididurans TaxID=2784346 RepID=A0ABS2U066_9ACTN|nr:hypothetical protein [Actinacidiphila acididurans]MBM9508998.1 hypothetical protein [Actinacidiphila acididurans]
MRHQRSTVVVLATAILALSGCSGGHGGKGALEDAVRARSHAYYKGDLKAYRARESQRCLEVGSLEVLVRGMAADGRKYGDPAITSLSVDTISGDHATVSYGYGRPELDQKQQPWVREKGHWVDDDCNGEAGAAGGS